MAATVGRPSRSSEGGTSPRRYRIGLRTYRRIVAVALLLLCAIVVTGAAVRLTGSGLGCSSWPNCEPGEFIEIGDPNQAIEQLNRLFTGAVSLAVIAAVLGALRLREPRRDLTWLSWGLVAGVLAQIVLGGITVLVDLHPVAVAGHFLLSMILVCDATVLLWRTLPERAATTDETIDPTGTDPTGTGTDGTDTALSWAAMASGAVVLAVTGPLVTGSGPHAGDLEAPRFGVAIPDAARIHSLSAWLFCALVVVLLVRMRMGDRPADALRRGTVLLGVIVAQGALGYLQYERGIPAELVIGHIVGATAVAVAATWFQCGLLDPRGSGRSSHAPQEGAVRGGRG